MGSIGPNRDRKDQALARRREKSLVVQREDIAIEGTSSRCPKEILRRSAIARYSRNAIRVVDDQALAVFSELPPVRELFGMAEIRAVGICNGDVHFSHVRTILLGCDVSTISGGNCPVMAASSRNQLGGRATA